MTAGSDRPEPESEAALVAACAAGDAAAWARFVPRFGPLVAALARRMLARRRGVASDADVDEVTSGVFLALVAHDRKLLHRYRPEFRLSTYLGVICRTEVGRWFRRAGRTVSLDAEADERGGGGHEDPRAVSPLAALSGQERAAGLAALRAALDALPPRDRLLLTLKFIEGLDYARIAEVLHLQRDSVGQLLHRAKARLAKAVPELERWVDPTL
ncbi:MAG: sigma-70 family RNA polymerase sigma factor [Planctomycetia bacterium]|nr:sigma-70 family RNA polymerase sigma factor [Planctomycetia bacterium]